MIRYCLNPNCPNPNKPIPWLLWGRPPLYCSNSCKTEAYRIRKREERIESLHIRWQHYCPHTVELLEELYAQHGYDVASLATEAIEEEYMNYHELNS